MKMPQKGRINNEWSTIMNKNSMLYRINGMNRHMICLINNYLKPGIRFIHKTENSGFKLQNHPDETNQIESLNGSV